MLNLYSGDKPSYGIGRTLFLFAVAIPSFLFAQPTITSFSPSAGFVGTTVTISGTNFNTTASANIVYFGTVQATVSSASPTSLTVTVPPGTSYQPITVTTGGLTASSALPFVTTYSDPGQFVAAAFTDRSDPRVGDGPQGISSADFDGDGKPDLVVANGDSNSVSVYRNTSPAGAVSIIIQYNHLMNTGDIPAGVTAGDLDGDGKPDLVVTNSGTSTIAVFRNTSTSGNISFAPPVYFNVDLNSNPSVSAIADLNGDGKQEIAVAASGTDAVVIFANSSSPGTLSFSALPDLSLPAGTYPLGVVVADFDGDGKPDLATENLVVNTVSVFRNISIANGTVTFAANVDFPTGSTPMGLAAGDLDGDGKADLAVSNYIDLTVSLLRNTSSSGSLSFVAATPLTMDNLPMALGIADLDGDGKPDLSVINFVDGNVRVFRNTSSSGNISTATGINYAVGNTPQFITIADLDGDGSPDLVTSNNSDKSISILRNTGSLAPVISSFNPVSGTIGTVVTITGKNFTGATAVSFGGTPAAFTVVSSTTITATVGIGASGSVLVSTPSGGGSLRGFIFAQSAPAILSFTPSSGGAGTTVTIKGTALGTTNAITFGGISAASFNIVSDTVLTAVVGTGASGKIAVTSPYGADSLGLFTFTAPPPPPVILDITFFSPTTGMTGDVITIKGTHLTGTTAVSFGGISAASFYNPSDTVIIAVVGSGATGQLLVTGASGSDSLPGFTYQVSPPPPPPPPPPVYQINSFSPTSGNTGTSVTIMGSHLTGATNVSFGGTPAASFTVTSDSTIVATIGTGTSGQVKVISFVWQDSLAGFTYIPAQDTTKAPPPPPPPPTNVFQLLQFSGTLSGNEAVLQWSARNDNAIAYYVVERGNDSTKFTVLTSVPPVVKDGGSHNYSFVDPSPRAGINYYRLKMVDATAAFTYSHIIVLQTASKPEVHLSVYPNPVKYGFTMVDLPSTIRPSRFLVTDMAGKVIKTQEIGVNTPEVRLNLPGVIRGSYKLIWSDGVNYSWQTILVL